MAGSLEALARRYARELAHMDITPERAAQLARENVEGFPTGIRNTYLKVWKIAYKAARGKSKKA